MAETVDRRAEYLDAKALASTGVPTRVLLMAAMLNDDDTAARLAHAYPGLHSETMRRRWDSTDGHLLGDDQDEDQAQPEKLDSLGR